VIARPYRRLRASVDSVILGILLAENSALAWLGNSGLPIKFQLRFEDGYADAREWPNSPATWEKLIAFTGRRGSQMTMLAPEERLSDHKRAERK
jgi:hypothetical protein